MTSEDNFELSIVLPVYNEEQNISLIFKELKTVLDPLQIKTEIIFVNDASTDNSLREINSLQHSNHNTLSTKVISHSKNLGQMDAIITGIKTAKGQYIITMDCDLQHPTELVEKLWMARSKADVIATRQVKRNEFFLKAFLSKSFYKFLKLISNLKIDQNVGDFRLMSNESAKRILSHSKSKRVLRFVIANENLTTLILDFTANARIHGKSKYKIRKIVMLGIQAVVENSLKPLYLSIYLAVLTALSSFIFAIVIIVAYFRHSTIPGWASLAFFYSISSALLFVILGVIGAYVARIQELLVMLIDKPYE